MTSTTRTAETLYIAPASDPTNIWAAGDAKLNTFTDGNAAVDAAVNLDETCPLDGDDEWVVCYRPSLGGRVFTGGDAIARYYTDNPVTLEPNGWTTLPCGGAVLCDNGRPIRVSDSGREVTEKEIVYDLRALGWRLVVGEWSAASEEPDTTAAVTAEPIHITTDSTETECQYCGRTVRLGASESVAAESAWAARAAEHARTCEWVATRAHQLDTPSDERIRGLRTGAGEAGDLEQVELCDRALEGEAAAIAKCAMALRAGDAMVDEVA